jgi:hypothetical protein
MQISILINGENQDFSFDPSVTSVSEAAEYLCSAASLDSQSEVCLSTQPSLRAAIDRRDYDMRARDVALALASQVSLPDRTRPDQIIQAQHCRE